MIPTNITKRPAVGWDSPTDLLQLGINPEICSLYKVFYRVALAGRDERIYVHDVNVALLGAQLNGRAGKIYTWQEVRIDNVDGQGRIAVTFGQIGPGSQGPRYVVDNVYPELFKRLLVTTLR